MKINTEQRIRQIDIKVAGKVSGLLSKGSQFEFNYHSDAQLPVAVAMPLGNRVHRSGALFPIFEMNIPEGYIRHRIIERLRKQIQVDEMLFLALQGGTGIGCISYTVQGVEAEALNAESLSEILSWKGSNELFGMLVNKHLLQSCISGVQPKIIVPEAIETAGKAALILPSLIVKSADKAFPQLAINEYICMRLAKYCQIETPEFWLSDDHRLFVMRRFDLKNDGRCRAMEDMAVLQGKSTNDKYRSSYESISKVLKFYSSNIKADNETLFKILVHSCMVGNGDAHLKNFAMLYDDPRYMRLSPLYDVVNTHIYVPGDTLALSLGKTKNFPGRRRLVDFGRSIGVNKCENIIDEMAEQIRGGLEDLVDYIDLMMLDIKSSILENIHRSTTREAIKARAPRQHKKYY